MKIRYDKETKKWDLLDHDTLYKKGDVIGSFESKAQAQRYLKMILTP